jgi:hypothetical protein
VLLPLAYTRVSPKTPIMEHEQNLDPRFRLNRHHTFGAYTHPKCANMVMEGP